jgi:hypothetical protein
MFLGYPNNASDTFGVGKWLTREDLALLLMRYSEAMNLERSVDFGRSDDFMDYFEVDFDHWEAICWACTWHIIEGKGEPDAPKEERMIDPHGKATRQEFTEMVERMFEVNHMSAPFSIAAAPVVSTSSSGADTVVSTTATTVVSGDLNIGDVDGNNMIDGRDATAILTEYARTSAGQAVSFSKAQVKAADLNKDGIVDGRDASAVLSYYAYSSTNGNKAVSLEEFV